MRYGFGYARYILLMEVYYARVMIVVLWPRITQ